MITELESKKGWGWRELIYLLVLVLIFVPFFIEHHLYNYLLGVFQNELHAGTSLGLIMAIVFMTGLYLIVLGPNGYGWGTVGVRPISFRSWKLISLWTLVLIGVSILLVVAMSFIGIGTENTKTESLQSQLTLGNFLIAFVSASIISPIYEEIFYRGFLYRFFKIWYGVGFGLLVSSLIFTVVHIPTYNTLPVNFVSGLVFAWVYEKTGSVVPGIIIHGVFNGLAVILTSIA